MSTESAVRFETEARAHVALAVTDLDRSVAFYGILLGRGPTKRRPGYARFEVAEPPLNLALNEVAGPVAPGHPAAHLGIQVQSSEAVARMAERLAGAGLGPAHRKAGLLLRCRAGQGVGRRPGRQQVGGVRRHG